jgi:hypothetical protein
MHAPLVGCFSAALTRNGFYDLDLFVAVLFDQMADVDDALVAGVGALEAGVMRLYLRCRHDPGWMGAPGAR